MKENGCNKLLYPSPLKLATSKQHFSFHFGHCCVSTLRALLYSSHPRALVVWPCQIQVLSQILTWSIATVSLHLAILNQFQGYFGPQMAIFGLKMRRYGRAPSDLARAPRASTGEFGAQNLTLFQAA